MATQPAVPRGMQRVYKRLERWRSSRRERSAIPEHLWAAAAELAKKHGVCRTAQVLRLEYGKLRRMVESDGPTPRSATASASFVELVTSPTVGLPECLIELEGPRGKMRIQWKGVTAPDLAELSRALWESA